MQQKVLLPQLVAPVERFTVGSTTANQANGVDALTYCDLETMQCFPFADDSADL